MAKAILSALPQMVLWSLLLISHLEKIKQLRPVIVQVEAVCFMALSAPSSHCHGIGHFDHFRALANTDWAVAGKQDVAPGLA